MGTETKKYLIMSKNSQQRRKTSVDLTEIAQSVKDRYVHLGLKNILSAGLLLFDKEDEAGKLRALAEAHAVVAEAEDIAQELQRKKGQAPPPKAKKAARR